MIGNEKGKMVGIYRLHQLLRIDDLKIPIFQATDTQSGHSYSLKKLKLSQFGVQTTISNFDQVQPVSQKMRNLQNEVKSLRKLKANCFIKCYHLLKTKNSCYFVYDKQPKLSLESVFFQITENQSYSQQIKSEIKNICKNQGTLQAIKITDSQKFSIIRQLAYVIEQMHLQNVFHGDLSGKNIFLSKQPNEIDNQIIKVSVGGFYKSQTLQGELRKNEFFDKVNRDVQALGSVISKLMLSNSSKGRQREKLTYQINQFIRKIQSISKISDFSISDIRENIQSLATKAYGNDNSNEDEIMSPYFSHPINNPHSKLTAPFQSLSPSSPSNMATKDCSPNPSSNESTSSREYDFWPISNPQKSKSISNSPDSNTILFSSDNRQEKQSKSRNSLILSLDVSKWKISDQISAQNNVKTDRNCKYDHFEESESIIKLTLKMCMFALASKQSILAVKSENILKIMIKQYKQAIKLYKAEKQYKVEKYAFLSNKLVRIQKNIEKLRKLNLNSNFDSSIEKTDVNGPESRQDNSSFSQVDFIKKMIKSYAKYSDKDILINTCFVLALLEQFPLKCYQQKSEHFLQESRIQRINFLQKTLQFYEAQKLLSILQARAEKWSEKSENQ